MERARKSSRKHHKVRQNVPSTDRLSALPDEVICHILSFLPIKFSVRTSVLGERWRFLWAHVPYVEFNSEDHPHHPRMTPSFSSIVKSVMSLHKVQTLKSFRLHHTNAFFFFQCHSCSNHEFRTCIATAIERNVQILDLFLQVELPQCLLTCTTLVDLTLRDGIGIPSSSAISLPSLKKLHLDVEYQLDLPGLLSGCPVLEEFIIEGSPYHNSDCCNIYSPTLKKLTIFFPLDCEVFCNPDYRVKINAPALRYFKVCECPYEHLSFSPSTSLIEAHSSLDNWSDEVSYQHCVLKFLDSLCNVKCLKLSGCDEFPVLEMTDSFVRFDKLTKLELTVDWRLLTKFLENADHLEVLIISQGYSDLKKWIEPMEERSKCLLYPLRKVTIDEFNYTEHEFNMVRYILKYARVLKRIEIHTPRRHGIDLKAKYDAVRRLALFHRGSKECELAFCDLV